MKVRKLLVLGGITCSLAFSSIGVESPTVYARVETKTSYKSDTVEVKSSSYLGDESAMSLFMQVARESNNHIGRQVLSYDGKSKVIYFDNDVYQDMYLDQRQEFMEFALRMVKNSKINSKGKNKIYNFLTSQDSGSAKILRNLKDDVSADIAGGREWWQPFNGPVTTILGIIALAIFIGTGISFVMDIAYMTLPMFRTMIDNNTDGKLPKLISSQAYFVTKDQDMMGRGEYMASYFKKRVWVVLLLFIALGYLNSGFIFDMISRFMQVFSDAFA